MIQEIDECGYTLKILIPIVKAKKKIPLNSLKRNVSNKGKHNIHAEQQHHDFKRFTADRESGDIRAVSYQMAAMEFSVFFKN
jgi:hypothetical protein